MLYPEPPKGYSEKSVKYGPYSPSRLIVARCLQRFFGQYIRKDRSVVSSIAAARGSAIHLVLSNITKNIIEKAATSHAQVSTWVSEAVAMYPAAYDQIDMVKGAALAYLSNPSPYLNHTTSCEKSFAVKYYEEDSFLDNIVPARAFVAVDYDNAEGFPNTEAFFGGRLDQVTVDETTKTVVILDHKSTPSANKDEDHNFQLGCYAWLVSQFYPGYQIKTVIHYAHPALNFYSPPTYWNSQELAEFESYILDRIWTIEHMSEFPAIPGSGCDYCHMTQECSMNQALIAQKARGEIDLNVRSHADLPRIAAHLRAIGALYDELNKALKKGIETHAKENGIAIEGMWYGFKASDESVDWVSTDLKIREESARAKQLLVDPTRLTPEEIAKYEKMAQLPDLAAVLNKWGVRSDTFKEWQGQKLKQLWKLDKPGLLEMLKEYVVKDRSTRFGGYKN